MPFSVKMDSIVTRITLFTLALLLAGCAEDRPELSGGLYFAAGNYLAELDLRNGNTRVVTSIGDDTIGELARESNGRLLLSVVGEVNRQDVHSLVLYDLDTKQQLRFFAGRKGRYLPGTDVLVYDDGRQVLVKRREGGAWETIEVASRDYRVSVQIIPVSATAFLYAIGDEPPLLFDVGERTSSSPGLAEHCKLDGAVWAAALDALLCRTGNRRESYAFVTLGGDVGALLELPEGRMLNAVAYAADQDIVIFTERWQSFVSERPQHAIWIHHRDTGRNYRLVENQHLGETVVYRPAPGQVSLTR